MFIGKRKLCLKCDSGSGGENGDGGNGINGDGGGGGCWCITGRREYIIVISPSLFITWGRQVRSG